MRALVGALLLLLTPPLAGCAPRQSQGEPALWRVTDADSEIWLFGTAHMLRPELRWRGPRFEAAFAAADELVTETDASPEMNRTLQALYQRHGALGPGETLADRLGPAEHARTQRIARALGMEPAQLERMRPWAAALRISYAYALSRGMRAEAGVENVLVAEARRRGMRLSYLETPEQQVRVLADLAPPVEARLLADTLSEIEAGGQALDVIDALWARGEVDALGAAFDAQWRAGAPEVHEAVILARNRAFADAIEARLAGEGRIFIAVGAAHLAGEGNVIGLLRERGLDVEGP